MSATIACDRYLTDEGPRELVILDAAYGSRLLVDRREGDGGDPRLLAHLAADEPLNNVHVVCREFLSQRTRIARPLHPSDFGAPPEGSRDFANTPFKPITLSDAHGRRYFLRTTGNPAELRWHRDSGRREDSPRCLSARDVIGALEAYDPVCAVTRAAVERFRADRQVSVATLSVELRRVQSSPIVLNRLLREAVLAAVAEHGISLSAIAMACGRVKRDERGNGSGETSWLARRVGLLPAAPGGRPNPWVHSDTLALIARDGLGIAPREVELA
jgi:hypothetical protein